MFFFFKDATADAAAESAELSATAPLLQAKLLAWSGLQIQGSRMRKLYHGQNAQNLYFDSGTVGGSSGYIFFRESPTSPSPWLIIALGSRTPSTAACVEALRRFNGSFGV
ncbi:MAG: hypothetical protein JSR24_07485 [Proteobacteria bacterium]|nr:hypothetical protein [Pseudomonadota bacterium]